MQFGFCYISDYHERLHGDYRAWYQRLLTEWETADRLGYDAIWIAEHRYPGYAFSSTPVVAQAIADRTKQIRVGTAVTLLPQRHPILTAEDWATVDLLSGGRLNFGIGRGIFAYDFAAMGISSTESRSRFEESWEIIRRLWTEDDVTHEGKYWSFANHTLRPQPLQKPTPPAFVACIATPESYEWAGRHGMHLMVAPFLLKSNQQQREFLDLYRDSLAKAGHDPANFQVVANYHLALVEREDNQNWADRYIYRYLDFLERAKASHGAQLDPAQYAAYASGDALSKDVTELRENRAVVGTPERCIDRIGELAEACGLSSWMFHINYGGISHERVVEQMHLFADRVAPALGGLHKVSESLANGQPKAAERLSPVGAANHASSNGSSVHPTYAADADGLMAGARNMTSHAVGYWRSCVMFAANKLDVFTAIGSHRRTAVEVANQLQLDPRGTEKLLNACASLGLLVTDQSSYWLSPESRVFLDRASERYLGDWMAHWADMMTKGNWQRLDESVRSGRPVELEDRPFGFDKDRDPLHNWIVGMHEMGVAGHADLVASAVSLDECGSLLDVGGGPGTYSIYLCQKFPQLQATIVDGIEVASEARKLIRAANLRDRIRFAHLDFRTQAVGREFDVVLLSNVLHMCRKAEATAMLHNASDHLASHGQLLVQEWILRDDATGPELASLFDLHMLINPDGDVFRLGELREMITRAGFVIREVIPTGGLYDLIVAEKRHA